MRVKSEMFSRLWKVKRPPLGRADADNLGLYIRLDSYSCHHFYGV